MTEYLLEFEAYTGILVNLSYVQTIRVATRTYSTGPDDTPANTVYAGAMLNAGELKRQMFDNGGTIGKPATNVGFFEIGNADGSRTNWIDYGVGGRAFRLYAIDSVASAFSTKVLLFAGTLRGFASSDVRKSLQLRVRDKLELLDKPVLADLFGPRVYGGTTTSGGAANPRDGDANLKGQPHPRGYGDILKISPPLVNRFSLIYETGSNIATSNIVVYDGGVALTNDGTELDINGLIAATIAPGHYKTTSEMFRLGGAPSKTITADYQSNASAWSSSKDSYEPGPLAKIILLDCGIASGDIDASSFDEIKSGSSAGVYRCGVYIDDLTTTILDAVSQILASVGAAITSTADDKFKAAVLSSLPLPADATAAAALTLPQHVAVDTFTERDIDQSDASFQIFASPQAEGDGVPAYCINLKWAPYQTTQDKGNLATSLNDGQILDLASPFRQTASLDTSIKSLHPLAQTLEFETQLTNEIGAQAEAARRRVLYGRPRNLVSITVAMDRFIREATIDMGDVVAIDIDHFGWSPKFFYVVGIHLRFGERKVTLTLWG